MSPILQTAIPLHTGNGIRNSSETTTDILGRQMRDRHGYHWAKIHLPVSHVWNAWFKRQALTIAREHILPQVIPGGDLIGHSHFGVLAWASMWVWNVELGNDSPLFRRILLLSPAMNQKGWSWERLKFERIMVVYNNWDIAIAGGSLIPGHVFGRAGSRGFKTDDPRFQQMQINSFAGAFNHSVPYFSHPHISRTVEAADGFFSAEHPPAAGA